MENFPRLQAFFETLKNYSFWQRLFSWPALLKQIAGAWAELVEFSTQSTRLNQDYEKLKSDLRLENERNSNLNSSIHEQRNALVLSEEQRRSQEQLFRSEKNTAEKQLTELRAIHQALLTEKDRLVNDEALRKKEVDNQIQRALEMQRILEADRNALQEREQQKIKDYHEKLKTTWSEHQEMVKKKMELICSQQAIEYVKKFPFSGIPDNAVRIADEIVIFDAKSPSSPEDLGNFKSYIKKQCEQAGKYTKHENVRKEVYMVIPSAAAEVMDSMVYVTEDYKVYIITPDAIEPVLLTLRKIEDYAFIQEIGPDERQAIVRVIGQLIYASKRRIQVDQFFTGEVMSMLRNIMSSIPESLKEEILQVELAAKLNPGMDKRAKEIPLSELAVYQDQQTALAEVLGAPVPSAIEIRA